MVFGLNRNAARQRLRAIALVAGVSLLAACYLQQPRASAPADGSPAGAVTVKRDAYGVPHVYADTVFGIWYGYGYTLAEDQLYQIEMLRRTAKGTVAAALGDEFIAHDRIARTTYDLGSLAAQYDALDAADEDIFRGIAAGISARIDDVLATPGSLLPREFIDNGFRPEIWSELDVVAVYVHSMARRFSDYNSELANLFVLQQLQAHYGEDKAWQLFNQIRWEHDGLAPTTIQAEDENAATPPTFIRAEHRPVARFRPRYLQPVSAQTARQDRADHLVAHGGHGPAGMPLASNIWVVGPEMTASGETVLVNGPQMGDTVPGYIWGIGLHGAGYDVVGSGPVGSPWLIFGTNGRIGWGATAGAGDTTDLYQEQLHPEDPTLYFHNGEYREMSRRIEVIEVRDAEPVQVEAFATVHGAVVQVDTENGVAYSKKRSWEGSEVASLVAWVHAMQAQNYEQWWEQVSRVTLSINNYYADVDGNIAYGFLGRFPERHPNHDFRVPASGTGDMEWLGLRPVSENPSVLNPTSNYIANWNNKPQPNYNSSDSLFWGAMDRVEEIHVLLRGRAGLSHQQIWDIVEDVSFVDVSARYFQALIADAAGDFEADSAERIGADILAAWDGRRVRGAMDESIEPGATLFRAFIDELVELVVLPHFPTEAFAGDPNDPSDGLADILAVRGRARPSVGPALAYNALLGADAGVPQYVDFLDGMERGDVLRRALRRAVVRLNGEFGADSSAWMRPGSAHVFRPSNYARIPLTDPDTSVSIPAAMNRGTENNMIVLAEDGVSYCDVTPPGQSGFVAPDGTKSPHYLDQIGLYADFGCKRQWLEKADVDANAVSTIVLRYH